VSAIWPPSSKKINLVARSTTASLCQNSDLKKIRFRDLGFAVAVPFIKFVVAQISISPLITLDNWSGPPPCIPLRILQPGHEWTCANATEADMIRIARESPMTWAINTYSIDLCWVEDVFRERRRETGTLKHVRGPQLSSIIRVRLENDLPSLAAKPRPMNCLKIHKISKTLLLRLASFSGVNKTSCLQIERKVKQYIKTPLRVL